MDVDIWADVRCPWCWIGLGRMQRAASMLDRPVGVRYRSFLLEPQGPLGPGRTTIDVATSEWGMASSDWDAKSHQIQAAGANEGLSINIDGALMFDSRPLHRLLKLATERGTTDPAAMWDAAFTAHFKRNEDLSDPQTLEILGSQWGVGREETRRALAGESFADEVAEDLAEAKRLGINVVPTVTTSKGRRVAGDTATDELFRLLTMEGPLR